MGYRYGQHIGPPPHPFFPAAVCRGIARASLVLLVNRQASIPVRKGRDECVIDWKSTTPSVGMRGTLLGFRTRPTTPRSRTLPLIGVQSLGERFTACLFSIPSLSSTPQSASAASLCRGDAIIDEYRRNRTWRVGPANIHHSAHCSCAAAHRAP